MSIEYVVDSLDQVEESLKSAYTEREGKFYLDADQYAEIKATGLKKKNSELLGAQKTIKEELSKYSRFKDVKDEDWEAFQDYLSTRGANGEGSGQPKASGMTAAELEKAVSNEKKRFERQLREAQETAKAAQEESARRLAELEGQVREYKVWMPVRDLATKYEVLPDRFDAFLTAIRYPVSRFDQDEDGKLIFKDSTGYTTTLTPEKAFEVELKKEFAWAFKGTGASGSGSTQTTTGGRDGKTMTRAQFDSLSPEQKRKAIVEDRMTLTDS